MFCMYWVRVFCEDFLGVFVYQLLVKYFGRWVDFVDIGLLFFYGCRGVVGVGFGIGRGFGSFIFGYFLYVLSLQFVGVERVGGLGVGFFLEVRFFGDKLSI